MTAKEAQILALLLEHKGEIVKREDILKMFWADSDFFTSRSLDTFITKIRNMLAIATNTSPFPASPSIFLFITNTAIILSFYFYFPHFAYTTKSRLAPYLLRTCSVHDLHRLRLTFCYFRFERMHKQNSPHASLPKHLVTYLRFIIRSVSDCQG